MNVSYGTTATTTSLTTHPPSHHPITTTMPSPRHLLAALATAVATADAAMGPAFSTGPVASGSFIREATSTLILPKAPTGSSGDLSLWVGMGTSNGDLIQSIADNWQSQNWAVFAYTLLSTGRRCSSFLGG